MIVTTHLGSWDTDFTLFRGLLKIQGLMIVTFKTMNHQGFAGFAGIKSSCKSVNKKSQVLRFQSFRFLKGRGVYEYMI